ncbi:ABC transporter permease [Pseudarthrobacter sulfonivorans]|uniref:ABC transporter permease n=1 Tax=Pseudarthrobacter sulfonivorans TaxID=121292 RepID=A0A0U3NSM1_9MICC|nr:ABC transporter permease [Pseudarthrobacter sulfonivorans]
MTWLATGWPQAVQLALIHLALSLPAIILSVLIALPLGVLANRRPQFGGALLSIAGLLYAVPALPLLIIVPALLGIPLRSPLTMVVVLTIYGVALLVRSVADAFAAVDQTARQAAVAIGHSPRAVFWQVELPLAVPVILSGVRVVLVSTVGLVTIGALVGISSLGSLFTDGFQRGIAEEVLTGMVLTVVLAMLLDTAVVISGQMFTPWTRARRPGRENTVRHIAAPAEVRP